VWQLRQVVLSSIGLELLLLEATVRASGHQRRAAAAVCCITGMHARVFPPSQQQVADPNSLRMHATASCDAGSKLKSTMQSHKGATYVTADFEKMFQPQNTTVTITIWHNTDDDCGPPCWYLHNFLTDMGSVGQYLPPRIAIQLVPRYTYATAGALCSDPRSSECQRACTNNRYCHKKLEMEHMPGSYIAQENIRQACLWQSLQQDSTRDTRPFWVYKDYFQQKCKNSLQTFGPKCSDEVRAVPVSVVHWECGEGWARVPRIGEPKTGQNGPVAHCDALCCACAGCSVHKRCADRVWLQACPTHSPAGARMLER
jgi:hypothetical protein